MPMLPHCSCHEIVYDSMCREALLAMASAYLPSHFPIFAFPSSFLVLCAHRTSTNSRHPLQTYLISESLFTLSLTRETLISSLTQQGPLHSPRPSPNASPCEGPPQFLALAEAITLFPCGLWPKSLQEGCMKHLNLL